jgi:ABC-type antimicrobial peptide transport system permease subunit
MVALGYFTVRDLLHDRWRSLLTILSLAVVIVGFLLLTSLAQTIVGLSKQAKITNNLLIFEADTIDPMDSTLNGDILETASEIAPNQIKVAFPVIFRHLTIGDQIMQVRAVSVERMSSSMGLTLLQGSWPSGSRQVAASEGAARMASWKVGSTINIYGTEFKLTGIVHNEENAFGSLWISYSEGQQLFGISRGFQVGYLSLVPSANAESVREKLLADPRISERYAIYLENVYTNGYSESISNMQILSSLMVIISLLVVTFGVYNATSLSLTERSLEISLLNTIGFSLTKIRVILFSRIFVLTLIAYGLGWLGSFLFINHQQQDPTVSLAFLSLKLTTAYSLIGMTLAIFFAFLGVWLASKRLTMITSYRESTTK